MHLTAQIPEEIAERRRHQEQAYSMIRGALGREGTYETPAAGAAPTGAAPAGAPPDWYKRAAGGRMAGGEVALRGYTIDPEKVAQATIESPEFRIASRLTAESEQLLKREGPLWDDMQKSVMGPIIEGSASFMNEQAEAIRREYRRGGAARNRARMAMQQMRAQEAVSSAKQNQLWQSNMAMNQWARDNARTQLEFNQNWAANTAGVRDSFHRSLDQAGELMLQSLPQAARFAQAAHQISQQIHAENRAKARRIYSMAIGATAMLAGGAGFLAGGAFGISAGTFGQVAVRGAGMLAQESGLLTGGEASQLGQLGGLLFNRGGGSVYDIPGPAPGVYGGYATPTLRPTQRSGYAVG